MKRNKRTEKVAHQELTPLTERILARMGTEGLDIRQRLQLFYCERHTLLDLAQYEELVEKLR